MQTYIQDGKTFAKIADIRPWPKNPKTIEDTDLEKLKHQISELGLYKPLLVTPDGEILGGNQRYKALKELGVDTVWVSVVEAWSDEQRFKYALSDNLNLGKYKREELYELIKPLAAQGALFKDYAVELKDPQAIEEFCEDFLMDADELRMKELSKQLKEAGINEETIDVIKEMSQYGRSKNKVEDVDIKGQVKEKFCLPFWVENQADYQRLYDVYSVKGTQRMDADLLIKNTFGK